MLTVDTTGVKQTGLQPFAKRLLVFEKTHSGFFVLGRSLALPACFDMHSIGQAPRADLRFVAILLHSFWLSLAEALVHSLGRRLSVKV